MGTVMALDILMGKSYKVVYDGQHCLSEGEVIHNQAGFQELINEIRSLHGEMTPVIESRGEYYKPVETFCEKNQLRYCILNPLAAKKQLEQGTVRSWKKDKHDAHKLAQVHQQNDRPEKTNQSDIYIEMRDLSRFYQEIEDEIKQIGR